ncbi:MAG: general secretion pathway protein GspK [Opitutales bacterium]
MALISVFAFLLLMAIFVAQFLSVVSRSVRYQTSAEAPLPLRPYAFSALEATIAVFGEYQRFTEGLAYPAEGWGNPLEWADLEWSVPPGVMPEIRVDVTDETGKIPLTPENERVLDQLLETLGVDFNERSEMIDSLADWVDDDGENTKLNGAEADWYERNDEDYPRLPANRPLSSIEELRHIRTWREQFFDERGQPLPVFETFRENVSLLSPGPINLNTAPPLVVEVLGELGGFYPEDIEEQLAGLDNIRGTRDDEPLNATNMAGRIPEDVPVGYSAQLIRARISVTRGAQRYFVEALIQAGGGGDPEQSQGSVRRRVASSSGEADAFAVIRLSENQALD